ncbi:outer membrane protein assembly factor BamA [Halomonadaceae bacterium KBTZ08]
MKGLLRTLLSAVMLALVSLSAPAETFQVSDIQVEGLQRVSAGNVFNALPVNVGDRVDDAAVADAIRNLFQTGLFADISMAHEDGVLIVSVEERPSIARIEVEGNQNIKTEQLMEGMRQAGVEEGQIFQRATLERLELEILRSYVAQGRYNADVNAEVEELPRNRVAINFSINEGDVAAIQHINIIGNEAFTDAELISLMELRETSWWNSITNADKYAREKLSGDLETLRSHYLNDGYVEFNIESTNISLAQDKKQVFVTLAVDEGQQFRVRDVRLEGNLIVDEEELRNLVALEEGELFSQQRMTMTKDLITRRLGREGYSFAKVQATPRPHDDGTVTVVVDVQPGERTYVRRVRFRGNTVTHDEVLRQEMTQMEAGVASSSRIENSRSELERTGFFGKVNVETSPVPGTDDQLDVTYTVEEQPTGSLSANIGFSQTSGLIFGASVSEKNFLGSGRRASFGLNKSDSVTSANLSYTNPFYTVDGVSRGFSFQARETDYEEEEVSSFVLDTLSARMNFGYPITRYTRLNFGPGYEYNRIEPGQYPAQEVQAFIAEETNSQSAFLLKGSIVRNTHNRGRMPTSGSRNSLTVETAVPGSDQTYYKITQRTDAYYPLTSSQRWVARLRTKFGYGKGFSDTGSLPFYEHYYAGGYHSVRGYEANSLGNRATPNEDDPFSDDRPFGGNVLAEASAQLIFPVPFAGERRNMRSAVFLDGGNVFDTARDFDPSMNEIRYSVGIGFEWITAIGPLGFSLAEPLNNEAEDDTRRFQFSLGQQF